MTKEEAIEILDRDDSSMRKGYFCINDFIAIEKLKEIVRQESKIGHWIDRWDETFLKSHKTCSACKHIARAKYNYCPNCGAKMESEEMV